MRARTSDKFLSASGRKSPSRARRQPSALAQRLLHLGERLRRLQMLEEILQEVTRTAVELTHSTQGTLRLLDESGRRLLTSARYGPSVHRRGAPPFTLGEGFIGWVLAKQRPACCNNPRRDRRFVRRSGQRWTPSAILAVPLAGAARPIGVLSVSRRGGRPYCRLDLELLRLVGMLSEPQLEIARLRRLGSSDALTLLGNRHYLDEQMPILLQRARSVRRPLVLAMLDLDHFKRVNDRHGHAVGDEVLAGFAERLRHNQRSTDHSARWGGEEFVAIFPDTDLRQASYIAERIRRAVCEVPFDTSAGKIAVSVSIGLAELRHTDDYRRLIERADRALYRAKKSGRNRVCPAPRKQS